MRLAQLVHPACLPIRRDDTVFDIKFFFVFDCRVTKLCISCAVRWMNPLQKGFMSTIEAARRLPKEFVQLIRPENSMGDRVHLPMTDSPQTLRIEQLTLGVPQCQVIFCLFLMKLVQLRDVAKNHQPTRLAFTVCHRAITCTDELALRHQTVFHEDALWPARLAKQCFVQRQLFPCI